MKRAFLISFLFFGCATVTPSSTVVLVRHAEKATGEDPVLTQTGVARAEALAKLLGQVDLSAIYSTNTKRTRQTAKPTAEAHGMEVVIIDSTEETISKIRAQSGGTFLVVGHSNTLPELLSALGVKGVLVTDYEDVFILFLGDAPRLVHLRSATSGGAIREDPPSEPAPDI